ncbi:MAG: hypothetical protein KC609_25750 [Myxococcales bacterium]|nr:hypothetical protein [Myxococcales bacterium]
MRCSILVSALFVLLFWSPSAKACDDPGEPINICQVAALTLDGRYFFSTSMQCGLEEGFDLKTGKPVPRRNIRRLVLQLGVRYLKPEKVDPALKTYVESRRPNFKSYDEADGAEPQFYRLPHVNGLAVFWTSGITGCPVQGFHYEYLGGLTVKPLARWRSAALLQQARKLLSRRRTSEAKKLIDEAGRLDPGNAEAPYVGAQLLASLHKPGPALASLKRALTIDATLYKRAHADRHLKRVPRKQLEALRNIRSKAPEPLLKFKPLFSKATVPDLAPVISSTGKRRYSYDPARFKQLVPSPLAFIGHGRLLFVESGCDFASSKDATVCESNDYLKMVARPDKGFWAALGIAPTRKHPFRLYDVLVVPPNEPPKPFAAGKTAGDAWMLAKLYRSLLAGKRVALYASKAFGRVILLEPRPAK